MDGVGWVRRERVVGMTRGGRKMRNASAHGCRADRLINVRATFVRHPSFPDRRSKL